MDIQALLALLAASDREYGMFEHFKRYPWVLDTYIYISAEDVLEIVPKIIILAEARAKELQR